MPEYAGHFEVHLTARTGDPGATERFADWCQGRGLKCVHIVLARGQAADQPMATWRRSSTVLSAVLSEADELARDATAVGFAVTRVKVEAAPQLTVTDTTFIGNGNPAAAAGAIRGGAVCILDLNALFTGCFFGSNATADEGGAIFQEKGLLNLDACNFTNNTAAGPLGANDVANDVPLGAPLTVFQTNGSNAVVVWV